MRRLVIAAVLAFAAAGARADPPPASPPILSYYPPAALTQKLDGSATLSCARAADGALADCSLVSETPAGQGFGAAALAIAARAAPGCKLPASSAAPAARPLTIAFHAAGPAITPDLLRPGWGGEPPVWLRRPTGQEIANYYPMDAFRDHAGAHVTMDCEIKLDGHVGGCRVTEETPPGRHFGEALLLLAPLFKIRPATCDGVPVAHVHISVPVLFAMPPG
ncbi:MAG TPA: hypothetical protein VGG29_13180 [Caulobacteraceae bacterium]|jgi:hypothetical protein